MGKKQKKRDGAASLGSKLPTVYPNAKCKLRLLKLERIKDYLLMEEEFVSNQEQLKPQEERNEEDRSKVGVFRGGWVGGLTGGAMGHTHVNWRASWRGPALDRSAWFAGRLRDAASDRLLTHQTPQVDDLRGTPLSVGTLEEIIDEK